VNGLPAGCSCPAVRHADGNPFIRWPDIRCPRHGQAIHGPQPRVIPLYRSPLAATSA